MGDTYSGVHMHWMTDIIQKAYTENNREAPFVYSIGLGDDAGRDRLAGYFGDINEQVAQVCHQLSKVPELSQGFDAIGLSQVRKDPLPSMCLGWTILEGICAEMQCTKSEEIGDNWFTTSRYLQSNIS